MGMYPAGNLIKITPDDLNAVAYTAADVIFTKQELKNAVPSRGGVSLLGNVTMFVEGALTDDDLALLFFDNSTALGEPAADPGSDITADEFRAASCIGMTTLDGGASAIAVGNGLLYSGVHDQISGNMPLLLKAAEGQTSIWVACIQYAGTLDLTDTDSLTLSLGFKYLG